MPNIDDESARAVSNALIDTALARKEIVVQVMSSPGVGKSTVAEAIYQALAAVGFNVSIADDDTIEQRQHQRLRVKTLRDRQTLIRIVTAAAKERLAKP